MRIQSSSLSTSKLEAFSIKAVNPCQEGPKARCGLAGHAQRVKQAVRVPPLQRRSCYKVCTSQ